MNLNSFVILVTLFSTGMMGTRIIVPLASNELGANVVVIGIIVSLFSVLPLFFSIKIGQLIDTVNFKLPIVTSIVLSFIGLILPGVFEGLISILISQLICGVAHTIFALAAQRYAGLAFGKSNSNKAIAQFSLGIAIGSFLGPLLAGISSDLFGYFTTFILLSIFNLLALIFTINLDSSNKKGNRDNLKKNNDQSIFSLLKNHQLQNAIIISTIVLFIKEIFIAYFPLYASSIGLSSSSIGVIIALHTLAGIIIRLFLGLLLSKYSMGKIIRFSIFNSIIILLVFPIFNEVLIISMLSFALGLSIGLIQPLSISITIQALIRKDVGKGLGLRITFNRLTQVLSPILIGTAIPFVGLSGVFWMTGIIVFCIKKLQKK